MPRSMLLTEAMTLPFTKPNSPAASTTNCLRNRSSSTASPTTTAATSIHSEAATFSRSRAVTIRLVTLAVSTSPADRTSTACASPTTATPTSIVDAVGGSSIFNPAPGVSLNFVGRLRIRQRTQSAGPAADQAGQQGGPLRRHPDLGKPHLPLRRGGEQD